MEHVQAPLGEIHAPHNFQYASASARTSATITDSSLIGRIALQTDDGSYWRLSGVSPAAWTYVCHRNNAGQIKANYGTSLQLIGFTANVAQTFDINSATPSLSSSPTTTFPYSAPTKTYADMFDATRGTSPTGRLIENPIGGQFHVWRVQGGYANKAAAQVGSLKIRLRNPVSGFVYDQSVFLADGVTTDTFNVTLLCIADNVSIPAPNGYILDALSSFSDVDLTITITSITRISAAVGYGVL